jgi:putative DNA-invertase from lambdoid prophage Rac
MRAAVYARVSTAGQTCENQLLELRHYAAVRGWSTTEYVDVGVSGSKDRRAALDELLAAARRRQVDIVICWRLDRLGRNLRHLVLLFEELQALGVSFVSLGEGIDCTTPAGKLQLHILAALAEFERERIRERIHAGLARARRQGQKLGRRRRRISESDLERVTGLSVREAGALLRVPPSRVHRERERLFQNPFRPTP